MAFLVWSFFVFGFRLFDFSSIYFVCFEANLDSMIRFLGLGVGLVGGMVIGFLVVFFGFFVWVCVLGGFFFFVSGF